MKRELVADLCSNCERFNLETNSVESDCPDLLQHTCLYRCSYFDVNIEEGTSRRPLLKHTYGDCDKKCRVFTTSGTILFPRGIHTMPGGNIEESIKIGANDERNTYDNVSRIQGLQGSA